MEIDLKSFDFYVVSLSPRTVTYKGMIMSDSLNDFYLDFNDEMFVSSLAIVHQIFNKYLSKLGTCSTFQIFMSQW